MTSRADILTRDSYVDSAEGLDDLGKDLDKGAFHLFGYPLEMRVQKFLGLVELGLYRLVFFESDSDELMDHLALSKGLPKTKDQLVALLVFHRQQKCIDDILKVDYKVKGLAMQLHVSHIETYIVLSSWIEKTKVRYSH